MLSSCSEALCICKLWAEWPIRTFDNFAIFDECIEKPLLTFTDGNLTF